MATAGFEYGPGAADDGCPLSSSLSAAHIPQSIELADSATFEVRCARPKDVMIDKVMFWADGQSYQHETDIYEMLA